MNPKNLSEFIEELMRLWAVDQEGFVHLKPERVEQIIRETARATIEAVRPEIPKGMRPIFDDIEFSRKASAFMGEK